MRKLLLGAAAAALIAVPLQAEPGGKGGGQGKGPGGGGGAVAAGPAKPDKADRGGGPGKARGDERGPAVARQDRERGPSADRGKGKAEERRAAQRETRGRSDDRPALVRERGPREDKGRGRELDGRERERGGPTDLVRGRDRPVERVVFEEGRGVRFIRDGGEGDGWLMRGCPPGLAKKDNGCMPPGLARKTGWDPDWFGSRWDDDDLVFHKGYLLRLDDDGDDILGFVPLLGGGLAPGQLWPTGFAPAVLPPYYQDFYGLSPSYGFYDDVLFELDPQTAAITGIAGLLTGEDIVVGQPMPIGYDVYNVPYAWRDQYVDGPDALYRYSDGYVYRVDPETQLVLAAIQLLT